MTSYLKVAPYAVDARVAGRRLYDEPEGETRTPFQRDRDRIVHATAFRRLKHKTQVFVAHGGDHYRTRLTHSLEVAQIARVCARVLALDEDLTEALALAHDLGHTPFGHAGERMLDECMREYGGFEHNAQTLRIVTALEQRYASFDGLNLTIETLDGLIKHNGPVGDAENGGRGDSHGAFAVYRDIADKAGIELSAYGSLEAQIASISDDIAYNAHDIDDGLRAGLFDVIDLAEIPVVGEVLEGVLARHRDLARARLAHEVVRGLIGRMADDVLAQSRGAIKTARPESARDVRSAGRALIAFSPQMTEHNRVLKRFLERRMYRHASVTAVTVRAERVLKELFAAYWTQADALPRDWGEGLDELAEPRKARRIADFIAGMTDRFALAEHRRLFDLDAVNPQ